MSGTRVTISGAPTPREALELHREIFPEPGTYWVSDDSALAKALKMPPATPAELEEPFEEWFLAELERVSREEFTSARDAVWRALDRLLVSSNVESPAQLDADKLEQALFDLSHASTARMIGLDVRIDVKRRLQAIGFTPREMLDFPGVAYRMGVTYDRLRVGDRVPFKQLIRLAGEYPLRTSELSAIRYARQHAGMYLRPVFNRAGQLWIGDRDVVRSVTERALVRRTHPLKAARELDKLNRAAGVQRDAERVIRTEMADCRGHGLWDAQIAQLLAEALLFRIPSAHACSECKRLYAPEGERRLYTKAEVEAQDALGYNDEKPFHVRIGATHPHCVCSPFLRHIAIPQTNPKEAA